MLRHHTLLKALPRKNLPVFPHFIGKCDLTTIQAISLWGPVVVDGDLASFSRSSVWDVFRMTWHSERFCFVLSVSFLQFSLTSLNDISITETQHT